MEKRETAIVVGIVLPDQDRNTVNDYLDELELLADTAGAHVIERVVQERQRLDPAYLLGRGKVEEIATMSKYLDADLVIFDDDLTPAQIRNIEALCLNKILDRSGLILDIFARNARTRESRTQVELAQLNYLLPRLTRQWTHLSRQVGGIGVRGPGETQLEVDRRLVRKRIRWLEEELQKIEQQRNNRRKSRKSLFKAALVGYTNAGKSTLLNALTHSNVTVENRLFATLDSTIRAVDTLNHQRFLLIDTVGFIRKLPHHLVASFKSTLEETADADMLLHVIDVTNPVMDEHIHTVNTVLKELHLENKPVLKVFNKIDAVKEKSLLSFLKANHQPCVFVSASHGIFLSELEAKLRSFAESSVKHMTIELPMDAFKRLAALHRLAQVLNIEYTDSKAIVELKADVSNVERIERLVAINSKA